MSDERQASAVDRTIGHRLRQRRLELGMSQERLAELVGVTFQQVQKYEKGVNRVAASRLFDLAEALETPIGFFYEGLKVVKAGADALPQSPVEAALATPDGVKLITLFASIESPRLRKRLIDLAEALTDDAETG